MNLPKCSGYTQNTPMGKEYDCFALHQENCEECLCLFHETGGLWHPETGVRVNPYFAWLMFGDYYREGKCQD